jgi:hypothetical protein
LYYEDHLLLSLNRQISENKTEGRTFRIKENEFMVAKIGRRPLIDLNPGYTQELYQRKYADARDEMVWREYDANMARGDPDALRHALNVLRVIREAPD